jgi:hypothetical protein
MSEAEKPRVRTLETPMMPEHVHVPTMPPSRVAMAAPEARNYVHDAPMSSAPSSGGKPVLWMLLGMALMLALCFAVMGILAATHHVDFK